MSRSVVVSLVLHLALFGAVAFSSRGTFKPPRKTETYRVSIAPLPQVPVLKVEEDVETGNQKALEKKEEKAPPKKDRTTRKTDGKDAGIKKGSTKGTKTGLPDIKPQIYTGSGRGFSYAYYLNILLSKIGQNWHNPFASNDLVYRAIVYFEVDKDGKISNIRIEDDSGDESYNESALHAVSVTKKLPPLPQELSNDYLKVHLEFLSAQ